MTPVVLDWQCWMYTAGAAQPVAFMGDHLIVETFCLDLDENRKHSLAIPKAIRIRLDGHPLYCDGVTNGRRWRMRWLVYCEAIDWEYLDLQVALLNGFMAILRLGRSDER